MGIDEILNDDIENPIIPEDPDNPMEPIEPIEPEIPEEPDLPPECEDKDDINNLCYSEIPNFYDRVRFSLNSNDISVSNEMIDYFENAPMAEMKIKQRVPIWKELNEFKTMLFQTCIIYMTCYHLCPIISSYGKVTEQTTPSLTLKYSTPTTADKPCERFLWMIDDLVAQILEEEPQSFFGFKVTKEYPECGCKKVWDGWNKNNHKAFNPLWSE